MKRTLAFPMAALLSVVCPVDLQAQDTAFTYQGVLTDSGSPAAGSYDLRFDLFNASTDGAFLGTITCTAAAVDDGLFTVILDYGSGLFDGGARWLEIGVRPDGSPDAFTVLSPRQRFHSSPYAVTAGKVTGTISGSQIAGGTISGAHLASGAVTTEHLASGAVAAAQLASGATASNMAAGGLSGVPAGGMILSDDPSDERLLQVDLGERWEEGASGSSPAARSSHTSVWTGSESRERSCADPAMSARSSRCRADSWFSKRKRSPARRSPCRVSVSRNAATTSGSRHKHSSKVVTPSSAPRTSAQAFPSAPSPPRHSRWDRKAPISI